MTVQTTERALTLSRTFEAPRALVWKAWTDADHAMNWWGPRHHPARHVEMDMRPGGRWRHCLRSPATGEELWHHGVFREVVAPERLVFTFTWEEDGERGLETVCTVTFSEQGANRTLMTFHQAPFQSAYECDGHTEGWGSSFDRLADHLALSTGDAP